jgi:UDP-glucose 4-epimerase
LAAKVRVAESLINPDETIEVNVTGKENVISSAIKVGIPQFVFASSAAVYGFPSKLPISQNDVPRPISPYGLSKLRVENVIAQYAMNKQKAVTLRIFNV